MQAEEKKLRVLKLEIEAGRHSDSASSSNKVIKRQPLVPSFPMFILCGHLCTFSLTCIILYVGIYTL